MLKTRAEQMKFMFDVMKNTERLRKLSSKIHGVKQKKTFNIVQMYFQYYNFVHNANHRLHPIL